MGNVVWLIFLGLLAAFVVWFLIRLIVRSSRGGRSGGGGFDFDFSDFGGGDSGGGGGGND